MLQRAVACRLAVRCRLRCKPAPLAAIRVRGRPRRPSMPAGGMRCTPREGRLMITRGTRTCLAIAVVTAFGIGVAPTAAAAGPLLVEPDWLAARLQDRSVVVLHVGSQAGYDKAHIPGARRIVEDAVAEPDELARGQLMLQRRE